MRSGARSAGDVRRLEAESAALRLALELTRRAAVEVARPHPQARLCSVCREWHGREVVHPCE